MKITPEELRSAGFWYGGSVFPDDAEILRWQIDRDAHGFIVYMMVVEHEVMKAGQTQSRFSVRMASTFGTLRRKMGSHADHPAYQEQTFKAHAGATIRAGKTIDLWACDLGSYAAMDETERALNQKYLGLWTKEGQRARRLGRL